MTGQDLNVELINKLAHDCENIVGIKYSVVSIFHTRQIITTVKAVRPDFMVFAGYDEYLLDTLILGGDGAIPATANFAPELCCGIYRAFEDNDLRAAIVLRRRLAQLVEIYDLEPVYFGVIKEAMRMTGLDISTATLSPITPLGHKTAALREFSGGAAYCRRKPDDSSRRLERGSFRPGGGQ